MIELQEKKVLSTAFPAYPLILERECILLNTEQQIIPIEVSTIRSLQPCSGSVSSLRKPFRWESQSAQLRWQLVALLWEPQMERSFKVSAGTLLGHDDKHA